MKIGNASWFQENKLLLSSQQQLIVIFRFCILNIEGACTAISSLPFFYISQILFFFFVNNSPYVLTWKFGQSSTWLLMLSPLKTCLSWLFLHITFHWSPQGNIVALMLKRCHSSLVYQDTHKSVHTRIAYWECQWQTTTYLPFFLTIVFLFCSFIFLTSKLQYSRVSQSVSSRWEKSRWLVLFFFVFY